MVCIYSSNQCNQMLRDGVWMSDFSQRHRWGMTWETMETIQQWRSWGRHYCFYCLKKKRMYESESYAFMCVGGVWAYHERTWQQSCITKDVVLDVAVQTIIDQCMLSWWLLHQSGGLHPVPSQHLSKQQLMSCHLCNRKPHFCKLHCPTQHPLQGQLWKQEEEARAYYLTGNLAEQEVWVIVWRWNTGRVQLFGNFISGASKQKKFQINFVKIYQWQKKC